MSDTNHDTIHVSIRNFIHPDRFTDGGGNSAEFYYLREHIKAWLNDREPMAKVKFNGNTLCHVPLKELFALEPRNIPNRFKREYDFNAPANALPDLCKKTGATLSR